jgi:excinuclease UvrABC ATPase subunit
VIAQGTPEQLAANRESLTGKYLALTLARTLTGGAAAIRA